MHSAKTANIASAVLGALSIALGAFGAHALESLLVSTGRSDTWETATLYHLAHSVLLIWLASQKPWEEARAAWTCLFAGVVLFSGSLYLLCLTQVGWLGAITPIGGVLMIAGWLLLIKLAIASREKQLGG
jgi:uncharacterized membrane protein YgdD (TMEM256/DUF423 family)